MKVVILAGGFGTRLSEYTESIPKPMVTIGGKPLLWHIMSTYAKFEHKDFYVALGYKAEVIKEYFINLELVNVFLTFLDASLSSTNNCFLIINVVITNNVNPNTKNCKLNNKKFVDNAPKQVLLNEQKKERDTLEKIKILESKLSK